MHALKRTREKTILQPPGCCIVEMQEEQSLERRRHLETTIEMGKILSWKQPGVWPWPSKLKAWEAQGPAHSPAQTSSALEHHPLRAHPSPREKRRRGTGTAGAGLGALTRPLCPASPAREEHRSPTAEATLACTDVRPSVELWGNHFPSLHPMPSVGKCR